MTFHWSFSRCAGALARKSWRIYWCSSWWNFVVEVRIRERNLDRSSRGSRVLREERTKIGEKKKPQKKEEENQDKTDERARGSNAPWKLVDKEREWYHLYGRPFPNATLGTWGCPTSLTCVSFFKHFRTGQKILRLRYKQITLLTIWLNDRSISPRVIWCHSSRRNSARDSIFN